MKILLLGEYSGFFTNLKKGLIELGHEVTLASTGDGWKKIEGTDYQLYKCGNKNNFEAAINCIISPYLRRRDLYGYDVVQMISTTIYPGSINKIMLKSIMQHSKKSFVSVAGGCASLYRSYISGELGYYTFDDNPELCERFKGEGKKGKRLWDQEAFIYDNVNGIIPIMYEYAVGVRHHNKCKQTIPLPFDCDGINYLPNKVNGKIRIAHGVIREKSKGTSYIKEAMKIVQRKYPDKVEILLDGKMPLDKYLEWLRGCNILIDQCKEHCYGMNALYAMAEGRIVLGGASYNSLAEFGISKCPVIHIKPDVQQIVEQLEKLIVKKSEFEQLGYESRKFVEEFHDSKRIAQMYLDVWINS